MRQLQACITSRSHKTLESAQNVQEQWVVIVYGPVWTRTIFLHHESTSFYMCCTVSNVSMWSLHGFKVLKSRGRLGRLGNRAEQRHGYVSSPKYISFDHLGDRAGDVASLTGLIDK